MSYAMIQSPLATAINSNIWAVIKLINNAYVSPAGYVVGKYEIIRDNLQQDKAKQYLNALTK